MCTYIGTSTQATVTHIQPSELFSFNCAPLAMPGEFIFRKDDTVIIPAYSIDHYTINGPLLSIIPVGRSDSGRYSCTANNTAGIITIVSFTLNVVGESMCIYSLRIHKCLVCLCQLSSHNLVEAHCYSIGRGRAIVEQSRSS